MPEAPELVTIRSGDTGLEDLSTEWGGLVDTG